MGLHFYLVTWIVLLLGETFCAPSPELCSDENCQLSWTPVPNMEAALVGYNPMIANRFDGTDPGFRNAIFEPTYVTDDGRIDVYSFINHQDDINCKINSGTEVVRNYRQYRQKKSKSSSFSDNSDESFSINVPFFSFLTNFEHKEMESEQTSESSEYEKEVNFFKETNGEIYINEAQCEVYKISVDVFEKPVFTTGFVNAMRELHKAATNPTSSDSKRTLKKFISNFGTHYMSEAWLGATMTTETRIAGSSMSLDEQKQRKDCVAIAFARGTGTGVTTAEMDISAGGVSTTVGGWGVGSDDEYKTESSKCDKNQNDNSFFQTNHFERSAIRSAGALPLANTDAWAEDAKKAPSVVRFNLLSLSTLIREWAGEITVDDKNTNAGSWNIFKKKKPKTLNGNAIYEYLEEATRNYCETMLGEPCPPIEDSGCAYNNNCPIDQECIDDSNVELGFSCSERLECVGSIEINIAYPYNDLKLEKKSSIKECQAFCKTDTRCVGWDFNTKDRKCAIKFQRIGRIKSDGLVSGERDACVPGCVGSVETNINYPYNDINNGNMDKRATQYQCQEFCKQDPSCVGWNWWKSTHACWKKSKMANRMSLDGVMSGTRDAC